MVKALDCEECACEKIPGTTICDENRSVCTGGSPIKLNQVRFSVWCNLSLTNKITPFQATYSQLHLNLVIIFVIGFKNQFATFNLAAEIIELLPI